MSMQEFTAKKADQGVRADVFVASKYPNFTRSSLGLLFDKGFITLKKLPIKQSHKLHTGDKISVDETYLTAQPPAITLPIIYDDDDVIVIDKPPGVLAHSKGALNLEATVASFIGDKLTDKTLTGNRAGIVHRLDRATSGVMITAKNAAAASHLQKRFSTRKVKKIYLAVVEGVPEPEAALIDAPIMRNPAKPQSFKVGKGGKSAFTEYKVLKTVTKRGQKFSLLELRPQTGRTHQLRVHMAYIHHPIVGDSVYGQAGGELLLHASSLELTLPNGQRQIFTAETPQRINEFMDV